MLLVFGVTLLLLKLNLIQSLLSLKPNFYINEILKLLKQNISNKSLVK